jgi:hypothetical protein
MAYKFYQGVFNSSGTLNIESEITGNALSIDTGGVTVTAGASSFQALTGTVLTASSKIEIANVSLTSAGLLSGSNLVVSASALSASNVYAGTLNAPNLTLTGDLVVSGNTTLGDASGGSVVTIKDPTTVSGTTFTVLSSSGAQLFAVSAATGTVVRNMGFAVEDAASAVQVTLAPNGAISGSGNLRAGGSLVVAGSSSLQAVTASALSSSGALTIGGVSTLSAVTASALSSSGAVTIGGPLLLSSSTTHQISGSVNLANGISVAGNAVVAGNTVITGTLNVNGAVTFPNTVTIKDLFVTGTVTAVSSTNLNVADAKVVIASGSTTTASFDTLDPAGLYIGGSGGDGTDAFGRIALGHNAGAWTWEVFASGAIDPALKVGNGNNGTVAIGSTTVLSQTALFSGAITGSATGVGLRLKYSGISSTPFTPALSEYVLGVTTTSTAITISLPPPGIGDIGRVLLIKDVSNNASVNNITITPNGTDTIDGVNSSIVLNSNNAAVHCIVIAANKWGLF